MLYDENTISIFWEIASKILQFSLFASDFNILLCIFNFPLPLFVETYAEDFHSPIEKLARNLDTSLHRVQLMKASFYEHDDISGNESFSVFQTIAFACPSLPLRFFVTEPEISLDKGIPDLDLFATGRVDAYRSSAPEKNALPLIKMQFTSQFPPPVDVPLAGRYNYILFP